MFGLDVMNFLKEYLFENCTLHNCELVVSQRHNYMNIVYCICLYNLDYLKVTLQKFKGCDPNFHNILRQI